MRDDLSSVLLISEIITESGESSELFESSESFESSGSSESFESSEFLKFLQQSRILVELHDHLIYPVRIRLDTVPGVLLVIPERIQLL